MHYTGSDLADTLTINKLYSVHYFEYSKNFRFHGEKHNFWEFVYVDKGEITATADDHELILSQGNVIFHKPNEWHNIRANGKTAPNVAIVSFDCPSPVMDFFENKVLKVGQEQKSLISKILSEYTNAFSSPLSNIYTTTLVRKKDPIPYSEQLIKNYICEFLILFLRQSIPATQYRTTTINNSDATLNILVNFMLDHISENISIDRLMKCSGMNRMGVNRLFQSGFGTSPMQYFIYLKTNLAKKYLREDNYNISQIAELLGYSSIHYFSLQFKKSTGMSPSQYAASIKALSPLDAANEGYTAPPRLKTPPEI